MINYKKISDTKYQGVFDNGVILGDIYMEVDGFFVFWPNEDVNKKGYWESWVFREIADKLDEMNKPWKEEIDRYFNEQENKEL